MRGSHRARRASGRYPDRRPAFGLGPARAIDDSEVDLDQGRSPRRGDDGDDHNKGGEADDDDSYGGNAGPAPAGSVAPPDNGLFDSDGAAKVQAD